MNEKLKQKSSNSNNINNKMKNKSPLRYPGGKTRACKVLETTIKEKFNLDDFDNLISPFFGGGSFEFHMQNNYNLNLIVNDKFKPLYNFWKICKTKNKDLCKKLYDNRQNITKEDFLSFRQTIMDEENNLNQAYMYFIINRCSFSGATLSGGFSEEALNKRFTKSSIDRVKVLKLSKLSLNNLDFEDFINENIGERNLIFLDPPYYLEKKSNLYGNNGDMHEHFDHKKLYECISVRNNWIMTYNNCEYIKDLYKDFEIIETSWSYGMNKSKESSEIIIIG
jgi:DNA adenine methylase